MRSPDWVTVWSAPGFYTDSARHDSAIRFARFDHAYDENQAAHLALAGAPAADLGTVIDANASAIEAAGVDLHSYTAPGDRHVAFAEDAFYSETVAGTALSDWTADLLAGRPLDDVHCTDCRSG